MMMAITAVAVYQLHAIIANSQMNERMNEGPKMSYVKGRIEKLCCLLSRV